MRVHHSTLCESTPFYILYGTKLQANAMFYLNITHVNLVLDAYLQKYFGCIKIANAFDNDNLSMTLKYSK